MNAITITTETEQIENAVDALLTAAIAADRAAPLIPYAGLQPAAASAFAFIERLETWTKAQRSADELLQRPVSWACRTGIRTLGKRLHEIGGFDLMKDVCDRVAARDPANEGRRLGIIDHRWDGIGEWFA